MKNMQKKSVAALSAMAFLPWFPKMMQIEGNPPAAPVKPAVREPVSDAQRANRRLRKKIKRAAVALAKAQAAENQKWIREMGRATRRRKLMERGSAVCADGVC